MVPSVPLGTCEEPRHTCPKCPPKSQRRQAGCGVAVLLQRGGEQRPLRSASGGSGLPPLRPPCLLRGPRSLPLVPQAPPCTVEAGSSGRGEHRVPRCTEVHRREDSPCTCRGRGLAGVLLKSTGFTHTEPGPCRASPPLQIQHLGTTGRVSVIGHVAVFSVVCWVQMQPGLQYRMSEIAKKVQVGQRFKP